MALQFVEWDPVHSSDMQPASHGRPFAECGERPPMGGAVFLSAPSTAVKLTVRRSDHRLAYGGHRRQQPRPTDR